MLASPSGGKGCSVVLVSSQLAFDGSSASLRSALLCLSDSLPCRLSRFGTLLGLEGGSARTDDLCRARSRPARNPRQRRRSRSCVPVPLPPRSPKARSAFFCAAIDTPMLAGFPSEGHTTKGNIKRAGQPEEVANAILYLSSEMGSYCSGTTLKCDGGWSKWC